MPFLFIPPVTVQNKQSAPGIKTLSRGLYQFISTDYYLSFNFSLFSFYDLTWSKFFILEWTSLLWIQWIVSVDIEEIDKL